MDTNSIIDERYYALSKEERLFEAKSIFLNLYNSLREANVGPMTRMRGLEYCVFAPLAVDGPLNEEELTYINHLLNQHFTMEEANEILSQMDLKNICQNICEFIKLLPRLKMYNLFDMMTIAFLIDSKDNTINEIEDNLLYSIQYETA